MAEVRLDVDLGYPPDRVWHALTSRDLLDRWFLAGSSGSPAGNPSVGAVYQLHPRHDARFTGPIDVEVLEVDAGRRLAMQWTGPALHSEMTWALLPTASGCRLSVVQTGFLGTPQAQRRQQLREAYQEMFGQALRLALAAAPAPAAARHAGPLHPAPPLSTAPPLRTARPLSTAPVAGWFGRLVRPWEWSRAVRAGGTVGLAVAAIAALPLLWQAGTATGHQPAPAPSAALDPIQIGGLPPGSGGPAGHEAPGAPAAHPAAASPPATTGTGTGTGAARATAGPAYPRTSPTQAQTGPATSRFTAAYRFLRPVGDNYVAKITVTATGGGTASGWTVVITIPAGATVIDTSRAVSTQDGQSVRFTPDGNPQVPAGRTVSFTFKVHKPAGTDQPLSCSVDGRACSGLA